MNVAVYIRVALRGTVEAQRQALEEWIAREGHTVAAVYSDDGMPGTTAFHNRPAGRRLLDDIRDRRVEVVVVSSLDRLSRTPAGILQAVEEIHEREAVIRAMKEGFDSESPVGRFVLNVFGAVAEWETRADE